MPNHLSLKDKLLRLGLFGITMGYFEAAVVAYLRAHFYPDGFDFPLRDLPDRLLWIELGREAASILMLISVGWIAGRNFIDRFAGLIYGFGVWDITYYLWLKVFENWPASIFTDDLLFLIPPVWVGPVWAPVVISIAMIWAASEIWRYQDKGIVLRFTKIEWTGEIIAGLILIASFLYNAPEAIRKEPLPAYPLWLFYQGIILGLALFLQALRRNKFQTKRS